MKYTMLLIFALVIPSAFADSAHTWRECYDALDGKHDARVTGASSEKALNALLQYMVDHARAECKRGQPNYGGCMGEFIDKLNHCDGAGDKSFQAYVERVRNEDEPKAAHKNTNKPVQMTEDSGGRH